MRDRLPDLQNRMTDKFEEVELGPTRPSAPDAIGLRISEVRATMIQLKTDIEDLQRKQQHILALAVVDPRDKDVLEDMIVKIRTRTGELRKMVRNLDDVFIEFTQRTTSNVEIRIKKNQIDLLRKNLRDLINLFSETHSDYRSRVSVRVHRQLQAVGENVSEEDAERILDGNTVDQIFFREVNPLSLSAKAALEDVKQRHHEMLELEKTIATMQEIFLDMHTLVDAQSEVLDSIKQNVDDTTVHVQGGVVNLKSAVEYKKSANCKKVLVVFVVVIILLLVMAAIALAIVLSGRS